MKKVLSIAVIVAGGLVLISAAAPVIVGAVLKAQVSNSVGIIGGADGPTAIMVVGSLGVGSLVVEIVIGIFLIIAGIWGYRKCKK